MPQFIWGGLVSLTTNPADIAYTKEDKERSPHKDSICHVVIDNSANDADTIEIGLYKEYKGTGAITTESNCFYIRIEPGCQFTMDGMPGEILRYLRARSFPGTAYILFLIWEHPNTTADLIELRGWIAQLKAEILEAIGTAALGAADATEIKVKNTMAKYYKEHREKYHKHGS